MSWHRHVLFIGGFDPKSSAHYHRMYREAVAQRPTSSAQETVRVSKSRQREGVYAHWDVHWQEPNQPATQTRYTVMGWHDVVHAHWSRSLRQVLNDYSMVVRIAFDGTLRTLYRASPGGMWMAVVPLLVGLAIIASTVLVSMGLGLWLDDDALISGCIGVVLGIIFWRQIETHIDIEWLLRLTGFTCAQARDQVPALEQRIDEFADFIIRTAEAQSCHELLLVGHSTGSIMASCALARAIRKAPWLGQRGPVLSMLTLGHCTPILASQPGSHRFRRELADVAAHPHLTWIDYSAPADWAASAQTPPWLTPPPPTGARVAAYSPRFHHVLHPEHYQRLLRWRYRHELHMQYIKAPDRPDGYDPVALTASPLTLAEQHASLLHAA
jgi:hypothetical protein